MPIVGSSPALVAGNDAKINFTKMPQKVKPIEQEVLINKFAFCLLKHFKTEKIKVQDLNIKIHVEQLCTQDIIFLNELNLSTGEILGINISRSGKGLCLLIGAVSLKDIPTYLKEYVRRDVIPKSIS